MFLKLFLLKITSIADHFYASPEYDNTLNQNNVPMDPEEKERQEEEWRTDLAKVCLFAHFLYPLEHVYCSMLEIKYYLYFHLMTCSLSS